MNEIIIKEQCPYCGKTGAVIVSEEFYEKHAEGGGYLKEHLKRCKKLNKDKYNIDLLK